MIGIVWANLIPYRDPQSKCMGCRESWPMRDQFRHECPNAQFSFECRDENWQQALGAAVLSSIPCIWVAGKSSIELAREAIDAGLQRQEQIVSGLKIEESDNVPCYGPLACTLQPHKASLFEYDPSMDTSPWIPYGTYTPHVFKVNDVRIEYKADGSSYELCGSIEGINDAHEITGNVTRVLVDGKELLNLFNSDHETLTAEYVKRLCAAYIRSVEVNTGDQYGACMQVSADAEQIARRVEQLTVEELAKVAAPLLPGYQNVTYQVCENIDLAVLGKSLDGVAVSPIVPYAGLSRDTWPGQQDDSVSDFGVVFSALRTMAQDDLWLEALGAQDLIHELPLDRAAVVKWFAESCTHGMTAAPLNEFPRTATELAAEISDFWDCHCACPSKDFNRKAYLEHIINNYLSSNPPKKKRRKK